MTRVTDNVCLRLQIRGIEVGMEEKLLLQKINWMIKYQSPDVSL